MKLTLAILTLLFSQLLSAQIDKQATDQTRALYKRLNDLSLSFTHNQQILIGHQNAFTEGRTWVKFNEAVGSPLKSDLHDSVGIHPALWGLDLCEIGHWNMDLVLETIREVNNQGGVFTLSWHMPSLINDGKGDGSFYDTTAKVVKHIIPGGSAHEKYKEMLERLITFANELKDVPIIFRPFHEHTGNWFWWGHKHTTTQEYIALWRFTVDYLRSRGVHNFLYAYSPHHVRDEYLERYPGDNYVDILGVDAYYHDNYVIDFWNFGTQPLASWKKEVLKLLRIADAHNKIPAIAEFGNEGITTKNFWTNYFGWPLERSGVEQITGRDKLPNRGVSYIMLWRNTYSKDVHFYAPIKGHKENGNFNSLMSKGIFQGL